MGEVAKYGNFLEKNYLFLNILYRYRDHENTVHYIAKKGLKLQSELYLILILGSREHSFIGDSQLTCYVGT